MMKIEGALPQDVGDGEEKVEDQKVAPRKESQRRQEREDVDEGKEESKGKEERINEGAEGVEVSRWAQDGA
jgi:hypothetical protein